MRKEGGVIIGKTTTSEFGCKAVGDSPLTGITRNPWDLAKTPGGSSAGAAASVVGGALDRTLEEYWTQVFNRYRFREEMRQFMEKYDLLVSPVLPVPAFDVGVNLPPQMPDANVISWVSYTYPFNLTGQPGASLPVGFTGEGLPVGLQLISKAIRESDIFRIAAAFEAARPWIDKKPPMV